VGFGLRKIIAGTAEIIMTEKLPSIVIVGRPNVGKSTLFNRLTGTRRSIVTNEPGITRDRIYGAVTWDGKPFELVDTGGIVPDSQAAIPREILRQARKAIDAATTVVQIVDARTGPVPLDLELAELLRRAGKPPIIAANKVDTPQQAYLAAPFYEMGDSVYPISAEHGFGLDDMLDAITASFAKGDAPEALPEINVAIIGRPNVGKSTLLNRLVESDRAIVSPEPGTTRDAVDTVTIRDGVAYRFLDTAGIRRKGKTTLVAEKLSVIMARRHLERADVALLVVDASLGVTAHDATIAGYAEESGRSVIIVMNKWDLALELAREKAGTPPKREPKSARERIIRGAAGKDRFRSKRGAPRPKLAGGRQAAVADKFNQAVLTADSGRAQSLRMSGSVNPGNLAKDYETIVRAKLKFLSYAPIVFLSAKTGDRAEKLFPLIDKVAAARRRRISTGELNRWLSEVDLERGTSPASRKMKIYYITQASSSPPTFILFTNQNKPIHFSFERFLENQLRERFEFIGAPIRFIQRLRKVGKRRVFRP
jgi:GTP-binding protein